MPHTQPKCISGRSLEHIRRNSDLHAEHHLRAMQDHPERKVCRLARSIEEVVEEGLGV